MKRMLVVAALVGMMAGSAWAAEVDNAAKAQASCKMDLLSGEIRLIAEQMTGQELERIYATKARKVITEIGKRAVRGDEAAYDCATDYINTHPDAKVSRMLKSVMAAERDRLMLKALSKEQGVQ